jgi:hypothetical protein
MSLIINALLFCFAILLACQNNHVVETPMTKMDGVKAISVEVKPKQFLEMFALVDTAHYVPLQTTEESMIGRVDKLFLCQNKIIILDKDISNAVFVFDLQGRFLYKIDNPGFGPEQYMKLYDLSVDSYNNRLILNDAYQKRMVYHRLEDGSFLYERENLPIAYQILAVGPQTMAFFYNIQPNIPPEYAVILSIRSANKRADYFEYDSQINSHVFSTSVFSSYNDTCHYFYPYFNDLIYKFEGDSLVPKYAVDFGKRAMDFGIFFREKKSMNFFDETNNCCFPKTNFFETVNYMYFEFDYNNIAYNVYYSKTSGNKKMGNVIGYGFDNFSMSQPIAMFSDFFVSIITADKFPSEPIQVAVESNFYTKELVRIHRSIDDTSNPVLCFMKLKAF